MSLQETKSRISSSEFTLWRVYLQTEHQRFHREDYLFAMLAAEVRRTVAKHPQKVKLEHFLLDFGGKEESNKPEMSKQQKADSSKSMWLSVVGLNPDEVLSDDEKDS
jgi:hypothetical protein